VPLGLTHGWYRYHHLFRQLLLERFDELAVETMQADILKRSGEWFCDEGWTEDGLKCFLAADDLDAATDVIADHLDKVIVDDWSRRTLARWLGMFPPGAECTRLPLLIGASYMSTFRSDYEGVGRLLDEIDAVCRDRKGERQQRWRQIFQTDLGFLRAFAAYWHGDIESACEYGGRVLGQTSDPQSFVAMMMIMYYGSSLALTGRWAEYLRFIESGTTAPGFSESPQQLPYRVVEAVVHLYRGELAQCETAATHLTTSAHFPIPPYFEAIGYFLLGVMAYERNELDEAERHFLAVESRRFADCGERLGPLLNGVLERRADDAEALRILDAIGTSLQALHRQVPHPARAVRSTPSLAAEADRSRATPADGGAAPVDRRLPDQPGAGRARAASATAVQQRNRRTAHGIRGDGQDAHAQHLQEARRTRAPSGRGLRDRARDTLRLMPPHRLFDRGCIE
jgi:hypothetical protein